jgi:hypothetical protein
MSTVDRAMNGFMLGGSIGIAAGSIIGTMQALGTGCDSYPLSFSSLMESTNQPRLHLAHASECLLGWWNGRVVERDLPLLLAWRVARARTWSVNGHWRRTGRVCGMEGVRYVGHANVCVCARHLFGHRVRATSAQMEDSDEKRGGSSHGSISAVLERKAQPRIATEE